MNDVWIGEINLVRFLNLSIKSKKAALNDLQSCIKQESSKESGNLAGKKKKKVVKKVVLNCN